MTTVECLLFKMVGCKTREGTADSEYSVLVVEFASSNKFTKAFYEQLTTEHWSLKSSEQQELKGSIDTGRCTGSLEYLWMQLIHVLFFPFYLKVEIHHLEWREYKDKDCFVPVKFLNFMEKFGDSLDSLACN